MLVPYPFIVKYGVRYSLIIFLPCVRPSTRAIASAMVGRCLFIVCSMMAFTTFYTTFSYISIYTRLSSCVSQFIQSILWILRIFRLSQVIFLFQYSLQMLNIKYLKILLIQTKIIYFCRFYKKKLLIHIIGAFHKLRHPN